MVIALTGATGFVGRVVVQVLLAAGHQVRALVRDPAKAQLPAEVMLVPGDLDQQSSLLQLTHGVDAVIHIAGVIAAKNRDEYFKVNAAGTANLVKAVRQNQVPRLVHVSSLAARAPEVSAYGASKRGGEDEALDITASSSVVIIRPPAVYGPGDKATLPLIKALTSSTAILPGSQQARFSLILVSDLAALLVDAAGSARTGIIEVSDGKIDGYSWAELAQIAGTVQGKKITPRLLPKSLLMGAASIVEVVAGMAGKMPPLSRDKVAQLYHLDWVAHGDNWDLPKFKKFDQGFRETLQWYQAAGWLPLVKSSPKEGSAS